MLDDAEIEKLFRAVEADRVERKAGRADEKIKEAICAFSNDLPAHKLPGVVFIGQNDDLSCSGLQVDAQLLEVLGGWRSDGNILPFPTMAVRQMTIDGCNVAVIIVSPSENPPVRFKGRTWIRVGPRRATATVAEENLLAERRQSQNLPFDARSLNGTTLADLDLARFNLEYLPAAFSKEILDENGRSDAEKLLALRLISPDGVPTPTAMLTLGKDPRSWFPGAYVQFLLVDGAAITDPVRDQKEISGTVPDQIRALDELITLHVQRPTILTENLRVEEIDYPLVAVRQIVRNALLHRRYEDDYTPVRITWFNDRIEIVSPGGPFGHVSPENFAKSGVTSYRNPTLAESLKTLGYVDRFGYGLQVVASALAENGNPAPEYNVDHNYVHVTLRRKA